MRSNEQPIESLAFLSDCRTAALIDRDGTVVWYCPASFDAPSVFAALIDPKAGQWSIRANGVATTSRQYEQGSLIVVTHHEQPDGSFDVLDFLALGPDVRPHELGRQSPNTLVRLVCGLRGTSRVSLRAEPRFAYGLITPHLTVSDGVATFRAGPNSMRLAGDVPLRASDAAVASEFDIGTHETVAFTLTSWNSLREPKPDHRDAAKLLDSTRRGWAGWSTAHDTFRGPAREAVARSALVLQGLTDGRTGAVVAAPTTSLPERVGGSLNWDYRFAWLRDLSFVMGALWVAACPEEANRFLKFLADSVGQVGAAGIPILLRSDGRPQIGEHSLAHLTGFRNSRPVRVGNAASGQRQLDVFGEVLDSAYLLREQLGEFTEELRQFLIALANTAARDWRSADSGMWEARDRERQYTSSKVMCWVALDRAVALAATLGISDTDEWRRARADVHKAILARAWSEKSGAYAGAFDSDELDASVLLMPLVGFLPADDPRMSATIDAVRDNLDAGGPLIRRWRDDEFGFVLCSYWLVECEALRGDVDAGFKRFHALNSLANDVGLMAEMFDHNTGEMIGNFPQAFSHVGLINAAWRLQVCDSARSSRKAPGVDEESGRRG